MIYEYALVSEQPISILNFAKLRDTHLPHQQQELSPALLATNHQICSEATGVLYGLNTFKATVHMHLHQALRRHEVQKALATLRLPADTDLPEPEVICLTDRPQYEHSAIKRIRRFEVRLEQVIPDRPHWQDGNINVDHAMQDLCKAFIELGNLDLLILSSGGCAPFPAWLPAADDRVNFASGLEALMWQYHEWHFERALLAATKRKPFLWLSSTAEEDRIDLHHDSKFYPDIRASARAGLTELRKSRELLVHLGRTGQLRRRGA